MASREPCACCGSTDETGPTDAGAETTCYCPLDGVIDTVGKKYSMGIVALLGAEESLRYGDLRERLGASSDSTLSERLDQMAEENLIDRQSYDEIPPRVEYSLTPKGRELEERLQPLLEWAGR